MARELGGGAIIEPGAKQHVPIAIRRFSGSIPEQRVVNHTGWFRVEDEHVYLHAGGFIGQSNKSITTHLPDPLIRYQLPPVPAHKELRLAIRDSLSFLEVGEPQVTVPLLAAAYRSVLGPADMSVHLVGESGTYKSSLAGVVLNHFGAGFDRISLSASWAGTANSLQTLAWHAKDTLLVVDDYVPNEDNADMKAAKLFRAQGNCSGRSRLHGGSLSQTTRYPRGLILSTGEAVPPGRSVRARLVIVPIDEGAIDIKRLATAQNKGELGQHAAAMAGFIAWLAERRDEVMKSLTDSIDTLRAMFEGPHQHARAATNSAQLHLGMRWFLKYADEKAAIRRKTASAIEKAVTESLIAITVEQSQYQQGGVNEVEKFLELLRLVFHRQRGHLHHVEQRQPQRPGRWGWEQTSYRNAKPRGVHIGWVGGGDLFHEIVETDLYLLPDLTYQICQQVAPLPEHRLQARPRKLWRLLDEAGALASTEMESRHTRTIRKQLAGQRHEVIHLHVDRVFDGEAD